MESKSKILIYQVFTRLFGNHNSSRVENGGIAENGCGKMNDFDDKALKRIADMGFSHIWYTGIIRHATQTDYSQYGIPVNHPAIVKGKAGSPYAITDYYDVDPDLAVSVPDRMSEFEELLSRSHKACLKVVIDFVPNHVARQYHSICKPAEVKDLGDGDNPEKGFDPQNNFYYCPGQRFIPYFDLYHGLRDPYWEEPAKATGNDHFDNAPGMNDWYETVKLNYGVDYYAGRVGHFTPIPNTWLKMTDILLFWASKGVDAFRCDMAEMVPVEFWYYATMKVRSLYPDIIFIGEVYNPAEYHNYIRSGFDYLYDKVGMYDTMRGVVRHERSTQDITRAWQESDDIKDHMLYFLENHDEQRIASDFFAGNGRNGIPALVASVLMMRNPFMLYFAEEYGERGMDKEGFSGIDGRTTIFDYWNVDTVCRAAWNALTADEERLMAVHQRVLNIARKHRAVGEGEFFDLMYVNQQYHRQYMFLRKFKDEMLFIVVNFEDVPVSVAVTIPEHAFNFLDFADQTVDATDLMRGERMPMALMADAAVPMTIEARGARVWQMKVKKRNMKKNDVILNAHNKDEYPPAHTAEHLLNQVMKRLFGCDRSYNAHIERKKSKMSFHLERKPTRQEEKEIERMMREAIDADYPVIFEYVSRDNLPEDISLDRLPQDASDTIKLVRIGDFDVCPCIGRHVRSTSQIGRFEMLGTNWDEIEHSFRVRFKIV